MNLRPLKNSEKLQYEANELIAHGALTNSKRPQCFVRGVYPTHINHGLGAFVTDVDENGYVDYICALGSMLFGYREQNIEKAVIDQIKNRGPIFSLGTEIEIRVAEKFRNTFHYLHQIRFLKTGTEACQAAIRIARSYTGRSHIISHGYHGWSDEFTSLTPPANGVPSHKNISRLDDFGDIELAAAVIVEPVITDWSRERIDFLHSLRNHTQKYGTLLIFDETITGLRFPGLSVAKYTGIDPDLTIMGKSIGGGYPLALVGGRKEVMSCEYFVSSTFAGDCVALAACSAVMDIVRTPGVMENLHIRANSFCRRFNEIAPEVIAIQGYGTRGSLIGSDIHKALFMQEAVKAGALFGPSFFYGTQHHIWDDSILSACRSILNRIRMEEVKLEGEMPQKPYAMKARNQ